MSDYSRGPRSNTTNMTPRSGDEERAARRERYRAAARQSGAKIRPPGSTTMPSTKDRMEGIEDLGRTASGQKIRRGRGIESPRILTSNGVLNINKDSNADTMEAIAELLKDGYSINANNMPHLDAKCEALLSDIGFSLVETEELSPGLENLKEFSLIGSTNVDETIENSKILDPDLNKLTPDATSTIEKFGSESDPFYDLDEIRPRNVRSAVYQAKREKMASAHISVAKKLVLRSRKSRNKMLRRRKNINRSPNS